MRSGTRKTVAGGLLALALGAGALSAETMTGERFELAPQAWVAGPDTTPETLSRAFRTAATRAMPGVVHVRVEMAPRAAAAVPQPFEGTPWEDLFQQRPSSPAPRSGSGSGFVFRSDGYVLTNNHVVDGATRVTVVMQDKREFDASVVGRDPNTDIAVLKIEGRDLPVVALGRSDPLQVGDWVVALGYPLRLGATATAGIVSAMGRSIGILQRSEEASAPLEHFIQTDAAINPGNSGGPLVNLKGEVIGVNSAIASPTGYFSGYGFAVPIDLARRIADDLIEYGEARRPKLGVGIDDVDPADAEVYKLPRPMGVEVTRIEEGSGAERAGLRLGDVILAVDGAPVDDSGDLMELVARRRPGETVALDVSRYGKRQAVRVELGSFAPAVKAARVEASREVDGMSRLGFSAEDLTPGLARRLELKATRGVVVSSVDPRGAAARAGLRAGMRIESVNGHEVGRASELRSSAQDLEPGSVVSLIVRLPDESRTILNFRVRG